MTAAFTSAFPKHHGLDSSEQPPIVVGVDGSAESEQALRWAVELADDRDASLIIVTAYSCAPIGTDVPVAYGDMLTVAEHAASELAGHTIRAVFGDGWDHDNRRHASRPFVHHVDHGAIDQVMARYDTAAMIVMGTRRRSAWWHRFRSSATNRVTGAVACPVASLP